MNILIFDDNESNAKATEQKIVSQEIASHEISSDGNIVLLFDTKSEKSLTDFLSNKFFSAVSAILKSSASADNKELNWIGEFDVLIVDNDLTDLELGGAMLTAESIIGYLRAFTDVPYIISLNKNHDVDFDLRYLYGDYQSFSDLALNTNHLSNQRLWGGKSDGEFAPWYWPCIKDAVQRRKNQIEFVENNLQVSAWKALEFPLAANEYLSLRAKSRFSSGIGIQDATFEDFFESSHLLPPKEIKELHAMAKEGDQLARSAVFRISAYEVDRWLRRDVLVTQDVLIDLPHLLAQMPFLLGDNAEKLDCWNAVIASKKSPFGLDENLYKNHLASAQFGHDMWVPGPCFWWPRLKSDDDLVEHFFTDRNVSWPAALFCEDVSHFVSNTDAEDPPQEFEAEIDGSWRRRYITNLSGFNYSPPGRIIGKA
ncbi:MAG: hypothetical protein F4030_13185 [Gammaproteobacteria bacterium]|nr:hypothetical protein [Gammaproteobacteria bacterium]MYH86235.1 hypothetical protein [Gammaproteobacteria bacterium]MYK05929.1 hypothetical protein [Gammaproteobacteria bacterium]